MDADGFFTFVEKVLRAWLPTLVFARFRPANNCLNISVSGVDDFVITAMAASGANIRCEISTSFAGKLEQSKSLSSCTLRLDLTQRCLDVRLAFFLYEVFGMAVVKGPLEEGHGRKEWEDIRVWEDWLTKMGEEKNEIK